MDSVLGRLISTALSIYKKQKIQMAAKTACDRSFSPLFQSKIYLF